MWSSEGLECIFDLKEWKAKYENWEKGELWSILKEQKKGVAPILPLHNMILRANANMERQYEIYTFTADPGIDVDTIRGLFETSPQFIVDFIRKNGSKVHSNKRDIRRDIIK